MKKICHKERKHEEQKKLLSLSKRANFPEGMRSRNLKRVGSWRGYPGRRNSMCKSSEVLGKKKKKANVVLVVVRV